MGNRLFRRAREQWAGFLALFLVIAGGTAWANHELIDGSDVVDNSLTTADLKNNIGVKSVDVRNDDFPNGGLRSVDIVNDALTGDDIDEATLQGVGTPLPAAAVSFFNLASCPTGWSELTAAQGRYLVGLPGGGTLGGTAGSSLTDTENRAVGQHNHAITDPGHSHAILAPQRRRAVDPPVLDLDGALQEFRAAPDANIDPTAPGAQPLVFDSTPPVTHGSSTGVTVNDAGAVAGTNAPYLQLLACEKD